MVVDGRKEHHAEVKSLFHEQIQFLQFVPY